MSRECCFALIMCEREKCDYCMLWSLKEECQKLLIDHFRKKIESK
jgi:hypothetical protein